MSRNEHGRPSVLRRTTPILEGLEGRRLLTARLGHSTPASHFSGFNPREIAYQTPSGGTATIQLFGPGTLKGSSLDAGGSLRLVYNGTSPNSIIIANVKGGSGAAPLRSVDDADVPSNDYSGVNGNLVNTVRLGNFDLVDGGAINLTGGVGKLFLHSIGANTQIHLRDIPNATPVMNSISLNSQSAGNGIFGVTTATSSNTGFGGTGGTGTGGTGAFNSNLPIGTGNDNTPFTVPNTVNSSGRILNYQTNGAGAVSLIRVSGQFVPTSTNIVGTKQLGAPGPVSGIPGVLLNVGRILGRTDLNAPALIDIQGNLQALKGSTASDLVLNDQGDLGLVSLKQASDSVIIGFPYGHVNIGQRQSVQIVSTSRVVGNRAGVNVQPNLTPVGPLSLPLPPNLIPS